MDPIYLDHAATTPVRPEVREAMAPFLDDRFGNPSSLHRWGRAAAAALEAARAEVASALGADTRDIVFTRGGTESDNLALFGRLNRLAEEGRKPTLAVSCIEHPAVLDAAREAERRGLASLRILGLDREGRLDEPALSEALAAGPDLVVSLMWVNNEIGLRLDVEEIAARVAQVGGTCHSDAVQAVGKVPVGVDSAPITLLSVTGHKIYGPKGSGLLYVRPGTQLSAVLHGGGQERRLRPGTEDVAGAAGLARAVRLAVEEQPSESERLRGLRDAFEGSVLEQLDGVRVNAGAMPRAPHISSLGIEGVPGDALLMALDLEGIAASGGSACSSGSAKASHVIAALHGETDAAATLRISLGRSTGARETSVAAETIVGVTRRLRGLGEDS